MASVFTGNLLYAVHSSPMDKSDLSYSLQIRLNKLDVVLQELEHAGKVRLTEIKGKLIVGLRDRP